MFDLPKGIAVETEIDVSEGMIQTFEHGVITTWIGKRKTPAGHRIVRAGRVVGYLAESEKASILLGGAEAKQRLLEIEIQRRIVLTRQHHKPRHIRPDLIEHFAQGDESAGALRHLVGLAVLIQFHQLTELHLQRNLVLAQRRHRRLQPLYIAAVIGSEHIDQEIKTSSLGRSGDL